MDATSGEDRQYRSKGAERSKAQTDEPLGSTVTGCLLIAIVCVAVGDLFPQALVAIGDLSPQASITL